MNKKLGMLLSSATIAATLLSVTPVFAAEKVSSPSVSVSKVQVVTTTSISSSIATNIAKTINSNNTLNSGNTSNSGNSTSISKTVTTSTNINSGNTVNSGNTTNVSYTSITKGFALYPLG